MAMDRRGFLKLMGGLAALPVLGKFFKVAKKASVVSPKILKEQGMPDFFYDVIAGVKKFGKKKESSRDYDVYEFTDPKTKQKIEVIDGREEVGVRFDSDIDMPAQIGVKKGIPDELTKGKTPPDEYYEMSEYYGADKYGNMAKQLEEEGVVGGMENLENIAKRLRESKSGGGLAGSPPVFETSSPSEALKEIIRRTPFLGGSGEVLPIFSNENMTIESYFGSPQDTVSYGLGAFTNRGDIMFNQLKDGDKQIGVEFGTTATPNTTFGLGYREGQGPQFGLRYEKTFAKGGLTDTIPPERGPMPQGVESLFRTR